jgi:hypothetical protein
MTTDATTHVPRPRSPVLTMPNVPPATTDPAPGDTWNDLVLVLAIAGGFGLILALEALSFCLVLGWDR